VAGVKLRGVIFSDLGEAKLFMRLDWVKRAIQERVGFLPYPGTLNLLLESDKDQLLWYQAKTSLEGIEIPPADSSFCAARLYRAEIENPRIPGAERLRAAVIVPEVEGYPRNKIEVVAPVPVKETLRVHDGDPLTVEFCAP
jgi:CTP-dependent riboflavin kinase